MKVSNVCNDAHLADGVLAMFSKVNVVTYAYHTRVLNCFLTFCSGCRDNRPLYQVAQLAQRPGLNLENVTNISSVSYFPCKQLQKCFSKTMLKL